MKKLITIASCFLFNLLIFSPLQAESIAIKTFPELVYASKAGVYATFNFGSSSSCSEISEFFDEDNFTPSLQPNLKHFTTKIEKPSGWGKSDTIEILIFPFDEKINSLPDLDSDVMGPVYEVVGAVKVTNETVTLFMKTNQESKAESIKQVIKCKWSDIEFRTPN